MGDCPFVILSDRAGPFRVPPLLPQSLIPRPAGIASAGLLSRERRIKKKGIFHRGAAIDVSLARLGDASRTLRAASGGGLKAILDPPPFPPCKPAANG